VVWRIVAFALCACVPGCSFLRLSVCPSVVPMTTALTALFVSALGLVPQTLLLHRPVHTAFPILLRQPEYTEPVAPKLRAELPLRAAAEPNNAMTEKAPLLLAYFSFGCVAYNWLEGWSPVDSVYFLTVMATTVGYGDLTPTTDAGKIFTAVYALIGITTVFSTVADIFRQNPLSTSNSSWQDGVLTAIDNLYTRRELFSDVDMSCDVVTLDELRAQVNWPRRFLSCLLGPLLLFAIGIVIGVSVEGFDVINSVYWSAITMSTIGFGDASPQGVTGKLLAVVYLPVAVLVLADAVAAASRVAVQRQILETPYETRTEALLRQEAARTGDADETLTEAEFLISVLTEYSLVDAETINSIRQQFKYVVRYAEVGALNGTPPERGSAVYSSGRAIMLTNELVFREAVQKGEVPREVDLEAADGGYTQWYDECWVPRVRDEVSLQRNRES